QKQYSSVKLEHYLPDIHQWPDLLLQVNNKQIALEFQCAKISTNEIIQRNEGYKRLNIQPIWIIGASRFKRIGQNKLRIDTFTTQLLQCYSPALPIQLLYYCPYQKCFLLVSDLHQINSHQAIAQF